MSIPDILSHHPETQDVFARYGLPPEGYKALHYENLQATALVQQWDLAQLLADLNAALPTGG